uniref:Uncharacterized protein n=1 Tax=Sphaerodactylus townsendi TaxID=933632 RepID=A0ACB8F7J2_9SAUR
MGAGGGRDKRKLLMAPPVPLFLWKGSLGTVFLSLVSVSAGEAALAQPRANYIGEKSLEGIGKKETLTNSNKSETGCSYTKHFRMPAQDGNTPVISQLPRKASKPSNDFSGSTCVDFLFHMDRNSGEKALHGGQMSLLAVLQGRKEVLDGLQATPGLCSSNQLQITAWRIVGQLDGLGQSLNAASHLPGPCLTQLPCPRLLVSALKFVQPGLWKTVS